MSGEWFYLYPQECPKCGGAGAVGLGNLTPCETCEETGTMYGEYNLLLEPDIYANVQVLDNEGGRWCLDFYWGDGDVDVIAREGSSGTDGRGNTESDVAIYMIGPGDIMGEDGGWTFPTAQEAREEAEAIWNDPRSRAKILGRANQLAEMHARGDLPNPYREMNDELGI